MEAFCSHRNRRGIAWLAVQELAMNLSSGVNPRSSANDLQEGAATLWMALFLIGAFAEELWRAFCVIAFLWVSITAIRDRDHFIRICTRPLRKISRSKARNDPLRNCGYIAVCRNWLIDCFIYVPPGHQLGHFASSSPTEVRLKS